MLTNNELILLHNHSGYMKSNSFLRNIGITMKIIREGEGTVSAEVSTDGQITFNFALIKLLWFAARYYFITKEMVKCRTRIIEGLLSGDDTERRKTLISDSVPVGSWWMEYSEKKVRLMKNICIDYLYVPENRSVISSVSQTTSSEIAGLAEEMRSLFDDALRDIRNDQMTALAYAELIEYPEIKKELLNNFQSRLQSGFLTENWEENKNGD